VSTLSSFVSLSDEEKKNRGLAFTPREIAQQPDTWKTTLAIFRQNQQRITKFLEDTGLQAVLEKRPAVMLVGAGTSDYIGHALVLLLRRAWGCEVFACASTDLLPNIEDYVVPGRNYLWISFSRSGDSPEGVAVLEHALKQYPDIAHLIVTCNPEAKMIEVTRGASRACAVILDDAVNDRSLAMTSSFTNMIVMGQCLAHAWSIDEYADTNDRLVRAGRALLKTGAEAADLIASHDFNRVCFVGSGALASVAKESALKVLEMTAGQVKTMSETVLGLRHGPMAALDESTLLVCFVSEDKRRALYARDLLLEIGGKEITSERVAMGPSSAESIFSQCCEVYLAVEDGISDLYRPVLDVLFGQLLGLFCSVAHGLKPDAPSPGGVISRVVQQFHIY
jgi:tagatose-6-phosphate ketose/aldose isomerase